MVHQEHTESGKYVVRYQAFFCTESLKCTTARYTVSELLWYTVLEILRCTVSEISRYTVLRIILHITHTGILEKYLLEPEEIKIKIYHQTCLYLQHHFSVTYNQVD